MSDLSEHITKALQGTSGQNPVYVHDLRKIADKVCDDPNELYSLLDTLYAQRQVNRCSGMKDGKSYLAYWTTGSVSAPAPFRIVAAPRVHQLPPATNPKQYKNNWPKPAATPAQPAAPIKDHPMPKKLNRELLSNELLKHITDHPGLTGGDLNKWADVAVPSATHDRVKCTLSQLRTAGKITSTGKTAGMRYFAAEENAAATTPAATPAPQPTTRPSADHEHATKAAQCAELLLQDMQALAKTTHPLVSELIIDMLPAANQLSNKLGRLAGHIQQLHSQGDRP